MKTAHLQGVPAYVPSKIRYLWSYLGSLARACGYVTSTLSVTRLRSHRGDLTHARYDLRLLAP